MAARLPCPYQIEMEDSKGHVKIVVLAYRACMGFHMSVVEGRYSEANGCDQALA